MQRAALLGAIVGDAEVAWLERKPADLTLYGTLVDRQRRVLETLGLQRRPRDVSPLGSVPRNDFSAMIRRAKEAHPT